MKIEIPNRWLVLGLFGVFEGIMLVGFHYQSDHHRATIVFGATVLAGGFALYTYQQGLQERRAKMHRAILNAGIVLT